MYMTLKLIVWPVFGSLVSDKINYVTLFKKVYILNEFEQRAHIYNCLYTLVIIGGEVQEERWTKKNLYSNEVHLVL